MDAPITLVCLPYAGGSRAMYRGWSKQMPSWIDLCPLDPPGHGQRRATPAARSWPELVDALVEALPRTAASGDIAIFGHSMGALAGYELAHALRDATGRSPVWLGVSACTAPSRREFNTQWRTCSDETMIDELRRLGGTPAELLDDRDFIELALPTLRTDFDLCGTYRADPHRAPLDCRVSAFGGVDDAVSQAPGALDGWGEVTRAKFERRLFPGGHFYIDEVAGSVIDAVVSALSTARMRSRAPFEGRPWTS
ncbi:alpha/beta fold hydrolase [Paraburkholderia bryophila]|uniref:thioesterase II family protein n=1 Tax=Paraburkholderia bryophila TaxID=420952 RepID=UPI00234B2846|nr:alpha/beta fold hydrolase [Paraburkholderia bryophila]WCM23878.1 alpha/beta fold hydrolase [Paraburkholderia bryophila]